MKNSGQVKITKLQSRNPIRDDPSQHWSSEDDIRDLYETRKSNHQLRIPYHSFGTYLESITSLTLREVTRLLSSKTYLSISIRSESKISNKM